ncbi:hypothetical protein [Niabella drilacis]|uniref:Uncharacterized protein n=1 Tax=Niabella drilacis (strain DSM 25811 / CCM 8410 / CCUG 62505 / LMG 26954 / E90) TaxID=1285928 RepID=A0A1G7C781_NIADE|nr:hypothetical protein [Niabella drilacis]SDE35063.1 hypothetical protein SAMN04487894_1407 [Niabella drilacis]
MELLFKSIVTGLLILFPAVLMAQLTEHRTDGEKWRVYGQVKRMGLTKASLQYRAHAADSTFILLLEDDRKELKSFFSIRFNSRGNTLHGLYGILISFFEKENWSNKEYIKVFTLGETKVTVYKITDLDPQKTIMLSADKGRARLSKNEINQLFHRL